MTYIAAAIDIGTNSVKLTVGRQRANGGRGADVLLDTTTITRLGKNVDKSGRLDDTAVRKTLDALTDFARQAREKGAETIAAVGTSALRDAANGPEFVREAGKRLGAPVEIISGDREARLVYAAARGDADLKMPADSLIAVMDIGGGSTEVVIGRGDSVHFRDSLQLGAVRLTEQCLSTDPPTGEEQEHAVAAADNALAAVPVPPPEETLTAVGSGGTIANLAAMQIKDEQPDAQITPDRLHGTRLTLAQIEERVVRLAAMPLARRREIAGLEPDRADVIVGGVIIQARALRRLGVDQVLVSARGLRFGLLYELLRADR